MDNITYGFSFNGTLIQRECQEGIYATLECANKYLCPQLSNHFINKGIFIIVSTLLLYITLDFFLNKYWRRITKIETDNKFINDFLFSMKLKENRLKLKLVVSDVINSVMLIYILLVVYLNI